MDPIVIGTSRTRWIFLLVVALCFVAAGVFMLLSGGEPLVGWTGILFFGGCALVFVRQLLDERPRIVIDDRGILDRTLRVGVVEWADIQGVYGNSINGNAFLCLDLSDPAKYTGRLSPMMRRVVALNTHLGFTELSLNLSGADVDPERLRELIEKELEVRSAPGPV